MPGLCSDSAPAKNHWAIAKLPNITAAKKHLIQHTYAVAQLLAISWMMKTETRWPGVVQGTEMSWQAGKHVSNIAHQIYA